MEIRLKLGVFFSPQYETTARKEHQKQNSNILNLEGVLRDCLQEKWDGTIFIPSLEAVYMRSATG